jgi:hypothetical protein
VARRLEAQGWRLRPCGREVRAKNWTLPGWWRLVRSGDRERMLASQGRRFYVPRSTPQNRPCVDGSKPANEVGASRQGPHYRVVSSEGKPSRPVREKAACDCP